MNMPWAMVNPITHYWAPHVLLNVDGMNRELHIQQACLYSTGWVDQIVRACNVITVGLYLMTSLELSVCKMLAQYFQQEHLRSVFVFVLIHCLAWI